jgi:hypothetical protein
VAATVHQHITEFLPHQDIQTVAVVVVVDLQITLTEIA